jgi:hypothetical protein
MTMGLRSVYPRTAGLGAKDDAIALSSTPDTFHFNGVSGCASDPRVAEISTRYIERLALGALIGFRVVFSIVPPRPVPVIPGAVFIIVTGATGTDIELVVLRKAVCRNGCQCGDSDSGK